jgi:hypothetical protein
MTGGDLLILAPWVVFGAGLVIIGFRLWKSRRSSRRPNGDGHGP